MYSTKHPGSSAGIVKALRSTETPAALTVVMVRTSFDASSVTAPAGEIVRPAMAHASGAIPSTVATSNPVFERIFARTVVR